MSCASSSAKEKHDRSIPLSLPDLLGHFLFLIIVESFKFRLTIVDINHSLRVEHMTAELVSKGNNSGIDAERYIRWRPLITSLLRFEIDQCWEEKYHPSTFIHDGSFAMSTAYLARKLVSCRLLCRIVPDQIMMTVGEIDIFFVKDSSPLESSTCKSSDNIRTKIPR